MNYASGMQQKIKPLEAVTIAEFCTAVRMRENISQREAADRFKVNHITIAKAETGKIERPYEYLKAIMPLITAVEEKHMFRLLADIDIRKLKD